MLDEVEEASGQLNREWKCSAKRPSLHYMLVIDVPSASLIVSPTPVFRDPVRRMS